MPASPPAPISESSVNSGNDVKNADNTSGGGDLRKLVARARASPNEWHGVPGYRLALRVTPRGESSDGPDFEILNMADAKIEIENVEAVPHTRGYRRDASEYVLRGSKLHGNLSAENLPDDEAIFALAISGCLNEWPRMYPAKWSDLPSMIVNWCMPVFGSVELRLRQRMLLALAGSGTFIAAWWSRLLAERPKWFQYIDERFPSISFILLLDAVYLIPIIFALLFAVLCSWKIRTLGPIRIYVLAFILPYLVWNLIMTIKITPESELEGVGDILEEARMESN